MELKEFIKIALVDIIEGVSEAKQLLNENTDCVCPPSGPAYLKDAKLVRDMHGLYLQEVYFDIAVTTENVGTNAGKIGIKVWGLEAGIGKTSDTTNAIVSRIKFQVPIGLKTTKGQN